MYRRVCEGFGETQMRSYRELMTTTHFSIFSSGIFEEEDIKTRLIPYELYRTGATEKPFIHITIRILPGCTEEQKGFAIGSIIAPCCYDV